MDMSPPGPKGLGPSNIAQGLGWGFTDVLPWGLGMAQGLGWPGAGLGRAGPYKERAWVMGVLRIDWA